MTTAPSTQPVALVAGGSRGLGLLVARELVGHGYRVAVCARDLDEGREGAAQVGATAYRCDVSEKDEVAALEGTLESVRERLSTMTPAQRRVFSADRDGEISALRRGERPRRRSSGSAMVVWRPTRRS